MKQKCMLYVSVIYNIYLYEIISTIDHWYKKLSPRPPAAGPGVDLVVCVGGVHVGPGVAVVRVAAAHVHYVARRQVHTRLRGKYFYQSSSILTSILELKTKVIRPENITITDKAPIVAFSWLKVPTSAFTFKTREGSSRGLLCDYEPSNGPFSSSRKNVVCLTISGTLSISTAAE